MSAGRFDVRWAAIALDDLLVIIDFLAEENPAAATRAVDRLEAAARSLEVFPRRGRRPPELDSQHDHPYRELIVVPYRLLYRVDGATVWVQAVFDSRRDLAVILEDRLRSRT